MTIDLKSKTALVTGSGKKTGIGYGIIHKLADCGVNVILADLVGEETRQDKPSGDNMAEMIRLANELEKAFKVKAMAVAGSTASAAAESYASDRTDHRHRG